MTIYMTPWVTHDFNLIKLYVLCVRLVGEGGGGGRGRLVVLWSSFRGIVAWITQVSFFTLITVGIRKPKVVMFHHTNLCWVNLCIYAAAVRCVLFETTHPPYWTRTYDTNAHSRIYSTSIFWRIGILCVHDFIKHKLTQTQTHTERKIESVLW